MTLGSTTYASATYGGTVQNQSSSMTSSVINLIISFNRVIYFIRSTINVLTPRNQ